MLEGDTFILIDRCLDLVSVQEQEIKLFKAARRYGGLIFVNANLSLIARADVPLQLRACSLDTIDNPSEGIVFNTSYSNFLADLCLTFRIIEDRIVNLLSDKGEQYLQALKEHYEPMLDQYRGLLDIKYYHGEASLYKRPGTNVW